MNRPWQLSFEDGPGRTSGHPGALCRAVALSTFFLVAATAAAQHTGDVWVARSLAGQLRVSPAGYQPDATYHALAPVSGLLNGWSDDSPGFDRVTADDPAGDAYRLEPGVQVWLRVVAVDAALRLIDTSFQILDEPGEETWLGNHTLHVHNVWHIDSDDPEFDPGRCVWHGTFLLRDAGGLYTPSEPFTFRFANVPVRPPAQPADGDFDGSGATDAGDLAALAECLNGPDVAPAPDDPAVTQCEVACLNAFDFDDDRDEDLRDVAAFQVAFGAP